MTTTEIVKQNSNSSLVKTQGDRQFVQSLVINKTTEDLTDFLKNQVFLACVFRGITKTEEERSIIAMMVLSEVKRRFAYLSTTDIERCFKDKKFGSEFSNTVCPDALISCLEKSTSVETQRYNKAKMEEIKNPKIEARQYTKAENKEFAKQMLIKDFGFYLEDGSIYNLKNWNYLYITRILKFHHTLSEVKELLRIAETKACERTREKNPYYYRSLQAVLRDIDFQHTKIFKERKRIEFYNQYVGLFFKKVKNGKYQNDIFSDFKQLLKAK